MPLPSRLRDPNYLGFDIEKNKQRYQRERDRRVRKDAEDQFVEIATERSGLSHFVTDDHIGEPLAPRDAIEDDIDSLVIGGGWAGLIIAARLRDAGVDNFRIVEAGHDFGGAWYWNRYPGCQCDVQSYFYMPLLEETGYVPKLRFSYAPEIFEHAQRIGRHFRLYEKAIFGTWVTEMRWHEDGQHWVISTNRGDTLRARSVALATGPASRPRLPGIPGITTFKGHSFHTSRWDYGYTGGDPDGNLTGLADKRVGIIGTGATGVQVIPKVAESAKETFVFQRTPSTVAGRNNAYTDPEWARTRGPNWQRDMIAHFDAVREMKADDPKLLEDDTSMRFLAIMHRLMGEVDAATMTPAELAKLREIADHVIMEEIRNHVDAVVKDPETAEKLKPWYGYTCKRPTFNDEYLEAFNRPNVTLVDVSATQGVERITESGVVANGVEYPLDLIIYASGFEITSDFHKRIGVPIYGRDGVSIYDHWHEGMRTLLGLMTHGFPNLFFVGGLFTFTLSINYCSTLDPQAQVIAGLIKRLLDDGDSIHPTIEGEDDWIRQQIEAGAQDFALALGSKGDECTPGYYNHEGKSLDQRRDYRREGFGKGSIAYLSLLTDWAKASELKGVEVLRSR